MAERELDELFDHLGALTDEQLLEVLRAALDDSFRGPFPHATPHTPVSGRSSPRTEE